MTATRQPTSAAAARVALLDGDPEKSLAGAIDRMREWTPDQPLPNVVDDSWLRSTELPATTWCVPGRIPWGMWHCSAPPGLYKSALFDQVAHHIAHGTPIPGTNWRAARHGSVLVVSPDETAGEAQQRSLTIAAGGDLPGDGDPFSQERTIVRVSIPDGHSVLQRIEWLWHTIEQLEDGTYDGRRHDVVMIVWDTVGHLLGAADGVNAYEHADALKELNHRMANEKRLLAVTNHEGKDGRHIGSVGLVANANLFTTISSEKAGTGIIEAQKLRGAQRWTLSVQFDNGLVSFDDRLPQEVLHGNQTVPARIIAYLRKVGRATARRIREALGIDRRQVWTVLRRLWRSGELVRDVEMVWQLSDMGQGELAVVPLPPALCPPPQVAQPDGHREVNLDDQAETAGGPDSQHPQSVGDQAARQGATDQAESRGQRSKPRPAPAAQEWHSDTLPSQVIPATMKLWERTRVAGKYPIVRFPKLPEPLLKPGPDRPHQVWEGRPAWSNPAVTIGALVQRLDKPGSYLSSLRTGLPIGGLQPYDGDTIPHNLAGIHLVTWPRWTDPRLPHPGGTRKDTESLVWIGTPTLTLFDRLARAGRMDPVKVHEQYLAKSTEMLLVGLQQSLIQARDLALLTSDDELYEFQKSCYSKFVATMGESRNNWAMCRPDWQVLIRSQSYANLWRRADKAVAGGLTVAKLSNTDELHLVVGDVDWHSVFTEGRALTDFTPKGDPYTWDARDVRRARR